MFTAETNYPSKQQVTTGEPFWWMEPIQQQIVNSAQLDRVHLQISQTAAADFRTTQRFISQHLVISKIIFLSNSSWVQLEQTDATRHLFHCLLSPPPHSANKRGKGGGDWTRDMTLHNSNCKLLFLLSVYPNSISLSRGFTKKNMLIKNANPNNIYISILHSRVRLPRQLPKYLVINGVIQSSFFENGE